MSERIPAGEANVVELAQRIGPTDDQVRALAREILARGDYARWRPQSVWAQLVERVEAWFERALDVAREWLPDWLASLFEAFFGLFDHLGFAPGASAGLSLLEWLIGALLLLLVVTALIGVGGSLLRRRRLEGGGKEQAAPGAGARVPLAEAQTLAAQGHFLAAAHHVQLAALQLLLERRFVELARSEPNATLRARLSDSRLPESERGDFLALLDRLEGRWFRDRAEDHALYRDWCQLHARLDALGGRS